MNFHSAAPIFGVSAWCMQIAGHSSVVCRCSLRWISAIIWATADYVPTVSHDQQTSGFLVYLGRQETEGEGHEVASMRRLPYTRPFAVRLADLDESSLISTSSPLFWPEGEATHDPVTNRAFKSSRMDPMEDYKSPFSFDQGLNTNYLYLSPKESFTPPNSPALPCRGNMSVVTHVQIIDCVIMAFSMQRVIENIKRISLSLVFELHWYAVVNRLIETRSAS